MAFALLGTFVFGLVTGLIISWLEPKKNNALKKQVSLNLSRTAVSFENIRKLGKNVVTISSETVIKSLPKELKKTV